jgi:hypothetical protein
VTAQKSKTYIVGQYAILDCVASLEERVAWTHSETELSPPHYVFTLGRIYNGYQGRFSVDTSVKQHYDLHIENIRFTDAGIYRCIEDDGLGEETSIHVSVELGKYFK